MATHSSVLAWEIPRKKSLEGYSPWGHKRVGHDLETKQHQNDKHQYSILTHIYGIWKDGNDNPICKTGKETQMYRTDFWTLWEEARVGSSERTASKHVYYQVWNRSPVQVGCMRQVLRAGVLGRPRGTGWGGRWEGGSRWGTHINPWLIHVNVWQKPPQYCKVISLQLIKIIGGNNAMAASSRGLSNSLDYSLLCPIYQNQDSFCYWRIEERFVRVFIWLDSGEKIPRGYTPLLHGTVCLCSLRLASELASNSLPFDVSEGKAPDVAKPCSESTLCMCRSIFDP